MGEQQVYAVFLFPQAIDALGEPIKPYLTEGPAGPHILCLEVDTGGAFCELTLQGRSGDGKAVELELMIPTAMIRLILSVHGEAGGFGFA
jgi:hypothetical protein